MMDDSPILIGERKRPREDETENLGYGSCDPDSESVGVTTEGTKEALTETHLHIPFVPDRRAYEAGLEHARNLARASRKRKKELVEKSRLRAKELLIERERYNTLLVSCNDGHSAITPAATAVSLSLSDATELMSSLQNMDDQELELLANKQKMSDVRHSTGGAQPKISEDQMEVLRKDRNRIHAKKARLKRKIIAQELEAIEKKLEDELKLLRSKVALYFPNGLPAMPAAEKLSPMLAHTLDKIDSLAKYGDVLMSTRDGTPSSILASTKTAPRHHPSMDMMMGSRPSHPVYPGTVYGQMQGPPNASFAPQMVYGYHPPSFPSFYPPPADMLGHNEAVWAAQHLYPPQMMSQGAMFPPSIFNPTNNGAMPPYPNMPGRPGMYQQQGYPQSFGHPTEDSNSGEKNDSNKN